jgi:outer membrane protein
MKRIIIAVALIVNGFGLIAQQQTESANPPVESTKLPYHEAVKIALQNNLNLNQQKNNLYSRQVQKNQSIAAFLPNLLIQGQGSHTDGQQPNPDGGELVDLSVDNFNANIQSGVMLFNGLNRINTLHQASNQFKAQSAFVKRSEQEVVFTVTTQYLQVLLDQELLKIAEESFRTQDVLLNQLKEQVNLGARAESDLYAQDALVGNLEVTALRAKVTLENDLALLTQTLQLDPSINFQVEFPPVESTLDINSLSLDSLYSVALANREDLKQAEFQAKANLHAYRASISGYLPSISLFASYGSQYISSLKADPQYGGFSNQFGTVFPSTSYGFNLSIPIFDRMVTRSNRVFNKVTYDNSVLQADNVKKTIKVDVKRTYNNYLTAIQAYNASQIQFQAGELALRTQQESFVLGVASQVELAQANQTFVQAAASKAQAEITMAFQEMLMNYAIGILNVDSFKQ